MNQNMQVEAPKKKMATWKKVLLIILGIVVFIVGIFVITYVSSKKLVCKSNEGDITLMYNDKKIKGYVANNIKYDMDGQNKIFNEIGMDEYLKQFIDWFESETSGKCEYK